MEINTRSRDKPLVDTRAVEAAMRQMREQRLAQKTQDIGSGLPFMLRNSSAGKTVTTQTAMQLTVVCACVRILAEAVAGLPLHMYRYTDRGKEKAIDNRLYYLLHDEPNPEMTSFTFRETMMAQLLTTGNAYAQKIFNNRGEIVAIYPLISAQMQVLREPSGRLVYLYTYMPDDSKPNETQVVPLRQDEVWNIPGLGFNGLIGFSPIEMARNALGLAMATEEYGSKFFANGAQPSGVLEHPGVIKDAEKLRTAWQAQFGGSGNSNKIAVLEEGLKYHPISIPPDQAQFLESRKFQINEICRMYRIPPHMVGDLEKSSFSNIEQQSLEFVKYTLDPWLCRWEQSMQRCLLSREDKQRYFWKFNVDGLLRGDYQSRMQGYAVGRQNGWLNANDIRELENMDEIPAAEGGDLYLVNGNMLPLGQAGNFYKNGGEAQ